MVVVPVDRGESKGERRIRREVWDWHATEKAEKADPGQLIVAQLASGISTPMGHLVSVRSTCHASAPSRYFCCLRRSLENKSEAAVTKGIYAYSPPITRDRGSRRGFGYSIRGRVIGDRATNLDRTEISIEIGSSSV